MNLQITAVHIMDFLGVAVFAVVFDMNVVRPHDIAIIVVTVVVDVVVVVVVDDNSLQRASPSTASC